MNDVQLAALVRDGLDRHGHALQVEVVRTIQRISPVSLCGWALRAWEFPVEVRGAPFHIDVVAEDDKQRVALVLECKRVNPAFGVWCFVPTSIRDPSLPPATFYADELVIHRDLASQARGVPLQTSTHLVCDFGLAVKLPGVKGDGAQVPHCGPDAISDAVNQAIRGVNGLVNHLATPLPSANRIVNTTCALVPIVVTTARLLSTTAALTSIDIANGVLSDEVSVRDQPWLAYQVHVSPTLKHDYGVLRNHDVRATPGENRWGSARGVAALTEELLSDYRRTVYVVQAGSLDKFLMMLNPRP